MALYPAVPDQPGVDQITGRSFRIHATANTVSNGSGDTPLKYMSFIISPTSSMGSPTAGTRFTNLTTEQYEVRTHYFDTSANSIAIKPNTTYYVAVELENTAGWNNQSTAKAVKTPIAPMDDPTSTTPTNITSTSMLYNLDSDTTNGSNGSALDNAEVQWSTSSTFATVLGDVIYNVTGLTYSVTGLSPGTKYYLRGRTHNAAGWSNWSNTVNATTLAVLPAKPDAPTISAVTSSSVYGTYADPYNGGSAILERQIDYGTDPSTYQIAAQRDTTISGLARFTTYYFWARVRNSVGWSPWSASTVVRTLAEAPAVPTLPSVTNVTSRTFDVSFTKGDNGGDPSVTGEIGYGTDPNTPQSFIRTNSATYTVTGLLRNTTYYVWARADNTDASSAWTAKTTTKTLADYPSAPTPITFTNLTQVGAHIAFTAGADDGGGPILEWQVGYGTDPTTAATFVTYTGDMDINGLIPATTYYFWARGRNVRGWGPWSVRSQLFTLAGAIVNVGGVWKNAIPYVKQWGLWIRAQPYVKVNGVWKKTS